MAVGREAEGAGVTSAWQDTILPLSFGLFEMFSPFPTKNGSERVVGAQGTSCPSWLPWTPTPLGKPPVTAYAVCPICCVSFSPLLLSQPSVGLLRLGKQQGLRNQINR